MRYRINYSKVMSQARAINEQAERLAAQVKTLAQMEQECRTAWKGEAATVFINKLTNLRGEMNRTRMQMSTLADTIEYCANRIQREDEEAARRAAALSASLNI